MARSISPSTFLMGLGGAVAGIGAGIPATAYAGGTWTSERLHTGLIIIGVGAIIFAGGAFWVHWAPKLGGGFLRAAEAVAQQSAYWTAIGALFASGIAVVIALQAKQAADKAQNLARDVLQLRSDLNCWAAPRRLNEKQIETVAKYLRAHKPYTANFRIHQNDQEAGMFAESITKALKAGNWKTGKFEYVPDGPDLREEGLGMLEVFPQDKPVQPPRPPMEGPYYDLYWALAAAGFEPNSGGNSASADVTESVVTVAIYPKRKDGIGPYCPQHKDVETYGPPTPR